MFKKFIFLLAVGALFSCENKSEIEKQIEAIPVEMNIVRFDQKFAETTEENLGEIKRDFPYFFPENVPDSIWLNKIKDTVQLALNREVAKAFPDLDPEKDEIRRLFQHLNYYFPEFSEPQIVTLTSDVDFRNRVIATDSLLLLSLDVYLGEEHEFYKGIYSYLRKDFEPELLVSDIAGEYARKFVPSPRSRSFLAHIVYHGKILYLKDRLIPFKSDAEKIKYSEEKLLWAQENEDEIWRYFVEREYLYNTDNDLKSRFIEIAPYSKFYLKLDNESPPQIGRYLGWQIVRQFMERNDNTTVEELLATDAKDIFDRSKYKPEK